MRQRSAGGQNYVWRQRDQFRCMFAKVLEIAGRKAIINSHIVAVGPAQLLQSLLECREAYLVVLIVPIHAREHADAPHALALLRACRQRPCRRRAAEQRYELAPSHSITSSARPSNASGTVIPSALAVLRLMISSTLVDCWPGRSAGFSPLRMRPA